MEADTGTRQPGAAYNALDLRLRGVRNLPDLVSDQVAILVTVGGQQFLTAPSPVCDGRVLVDAWTRLRIKPTWETLEITVRWVSGGVAVMATTTMVVDVCA